MKQFRFTVQEAFGIHARPAGLLVKMAQKFSSDITMTKGEKTVSVKKLFALMGLNVKCKDVVTVTVSGEDEDNATQSLKVLMQSTL